MDSLQQAMIFRAQGALQAAVELGLPDGQAGHIAVTGNRSRFRPFRDGSGIFGLAVISGNRL